MGAVLHLAHYNDYAFFQNECCDNLNLHALFLGDGDEKDEIALAV